MKKTTALLLPLLALAVLAVVVTGCGGGSSSTSSSTATTAASTTTLGSSSTSTTAAAATSSTGIGTGGVPSQIAVQLTGDQEVPPVSTQASGTFTLTISMSSGSGSSASATGSTGAAGLPPGLQVTYKLEVKDIQDVTAADIRVGAMGQNGEVIYPLYTGPTKTGSFSGVLAEGPIMQSDLTGPYKGKSFTDLIGVVLQGGAYVNVETTAHPNGEIRGQIILAPAGSSAGGGSTTST